MNRDLVSHLSDADMNAAPAALLRGGRRARELARQTGTAALWVATWSGCLAGRKQAGQDDERLKHLLNKHLR